jgi:hypothetical protein
VSTSAHVYSLCADTIRREIERAEKDLSGPLTSDDRYARQYLVERLAPILAKFTTLAGVGG